jgi:hypothetical protein
MQKIAEKIEIENVIKTGFVTDSEGNPTEETYEYKEYKVYDKDDYLLNVGEWFGEETTVEEICNSTGIKFGVSAWIFE